MVILANRMANSKLATTLCTSHDDNVLIRAGTPSTTTVIAPNDVMSRRIITTTTATTATTATVIIATTTAQLCFGHSANARCSMLMIPRLNTLQATQLLISLLLPLGNQLCIGVLLP